MSIDREAKIRERAYAIWLDQGSVNGRDREHWLEAEKEIDSEDATAEAQGSARKPTRTKLGLSTEYLNASNDE